MDKLLPNIPTFNARTEGVAANPKLNARDNPQAVKNVLRKLENLWKSGAGIISKAPGLTLQFEITTGSDKAEPIFWSREWGDEFEVHYYGTSITVYDYISELYHIVCDQSLAQAGTSGVAYGDHFFTCNGRDGDSPGVIRAKIAYDAETAPFTAGKTLTGGTSGFTAEILAVTDNGATGILYLGNISGRPENNETITDSGTGSATSNGLLAFEWATQTHIPKCGVLGIHNGNRLALGDTVNDRSETLISRVDQESGIPFAAAADYTQSTPTLPDEASDISFKNGGTVVAFGNYSDLIIPIYDHGAAGFQVSQVNADTTGLVQSVAVAYQTVDWGGSRAIKSTAEGLVYVNSQGIHLKRPSGSGDDSFSFVDDTISEPLGIDFFDDFDTTNADIVEDRRRGLIIVNARKESSTNNIQIVFQKKKDLKGFSLWYKTLGSMYERNNEVYATDTASPKVYKLDFTRGDDDDVAIDTELELECKLPSGSWNKGDSIKLEGLFVKDEVIEVSLHIKESDGVWQENYKTYTLTAYNEASVVGGVGVGGIGEEGVGANGGEFRVNPNNFFVVPIITPDIIGLRVSVKTASKDIHSLTLFAVKTVPRGEIRAT